MTKHEIKLIICTGVEVFTIVSLIYSMYGIRRFFGSVIFEVWEDHDKRKKQSVELPHFFYTHKNWTTAFLRVLSRTFSIDFDNRSLKGLEERTLGTASTKVPGYI